MSWTSASKINVTLCDTQGRKEVLPVDTTYGNTVIRIFSALAKRVGSPNNLRLGLSAPGEHPTYWFCVSELNGRTAESAIESSAISLLTLCYPYLNEDPMTPSRADLWVTEHGKRMLKIEEFEVIATEANAHVDSSESIDTEGTLDTPAISDSSVSVINVDPVTGCNNSLI